MKKLTKLLGVVLILALVMSIGVSAFAGTIEVQNVLDGETYTAYKILNYTDNGETGTDRAVSYYLTAEQYDADTDGSAKDGGLGDILQDAGFSFTKSSDGAQYSVSNAGDLMESGIAEVAALLAADTRLSSKALDTKTATGASGSAVFANLGKGYYFVTSSAGSLCALHEDTDIAEVVEKNTIPTVKKTETTSGESYVEGPVDANFGDTVHFQLVVTDGTGTNGAITLTDVMTDGLDYTAGSLKINGTAVADDADTDDWEVTVSGRTIEIVFKAEYVATVDAGETITVTYDATINENAVVDSATGNKNEVTLTYSEQSQSDQVYVETYDFIVKKTDGTDFLDGAGFRLYDALTNGNEIKVKKDATATASGGDTPGDTSDDTTGDTASTAEANSYYFYTGDDDGDEILVNSASGVNVRGLAPGTYYLEETTVPDGYNKLSARQQVIISTGATSAVEVTVENHAGTQLPSTGGIGTTIFYVVGSILVIAAGVLLVTKKRMGRD